MPATFQRPAVKDSRTPWMAFGVGMIMVVASLAIFLVTVLGRLPWRDGANMVALILSVGGIWVGIYQLVFAVRAVRDAGAAAQETRDRMVATQQLDLLHRVRSIESRLAVASDYGN